ncbi:helix-turn-helix domain-containing protein [Phytomonospora endophytica]|uniref:DNA-binding CsgD family transcriptional regulator n=1 Tax=Phytomonospora endophytica TaxID=714109 RepID=A0A841FZ85_9ACTN|nr:helix-turn-helix transcriptional regulator [Phytomonospora endophytica]MBB6038667.1 DNA-binding CsgD family transcriptional regulator [Phytomonospora endophytica]GIG69188.1 hypothetical protein Pen01_54830 [Phytomonospora endophytica]
MDQPPADPARALHTLVEHLRTDLTALDELGHALSTRYSVSTRPNEVDVEIIEGLDEVDRLFEDLGASVEREILSMFGWRASAPRSPEATERGLASMIALHDRGVAARTIFINRVGTVPHFGPHVMHLRDLGHEIRLMPAIPVQMAVYDRRIAVLPVDPDDTAAGALVIRGQVLARSLVAVFEHAWQHAAVPSGPPGPELTDTLTDQHLHVLRMQAGGAKDEAIGRAMGISPRTVSRLVSEVHEALGTSSRFQTAVVATRLGLLG